MNPTNTHHTTGAELQTLREACGLDRAALGYLCGVEARTVKHWETRQGAGVPADVAARVAKLARMVRTVAAHGLQQARETAQQRQTERATFIGAENAASMEELYPLEIVLIRYKTIATMFPADAITLEHSDIHGAAITRLAGDLTAEGFAARVVWFDAASFNNWRDAMRWTTSGQPCSPPPDNNASRAAWAASAGLAEQSQPHRGDQPPATA